MAPGRADIEDIYPGWETLLHARTLVGRFVVAGWIEKGTVRKLDAHIAKLQELTRADSRTIALGGEHAPRLYRQIDEVTVLLVALADAAVEHQAALAQTSTVPATLRDARDRLTVWTKERLALEEE